MYVVNLYEEIVLKTHLIINGNLPDLVHSNYLKTNHEQNDENTL